MLCCLFVLTWLMPSKELFENKSEHSGTCRANPLKSNGSLCPVPSAKVEHAPPVPVRFQGLDHPTTVYGRRFGPTASGRVVVPDRRF